MSDSLHDTLDALVEADYWRLRSGAFRDVPAGGQAWHAAGYRHGYRDAIRHSASVGAVVPLLRRFVEALEAQP